jgi:hypothetical protein
MNLMMRVAAKQPLCDGFADFRICWLGEKDPEKGFSACAPCAGAPGRAGARSLPAKVIDSHHSVSIKYDRSFTSCAAGLVHSNISVVALLPIVD